ncbi:MAG TPA: tandem-95 repeat protein [bacterium]|nr:tandem-95 repeat protein [bacterium]
MNDTLVIDTLIQVNGTITGNSPVRIKDWFNWLGGTQSATDSTVATIIQTTALFNSGTHTLSKRTLINRGTISWTLGHWDNNTGAIIRNESGAIIDATAAGYYINYFGTAPAPKFINNGTFRVSSGSSYVYLNVDAINTNASYQIQSGTLQVSASATNVNTSWTLSNNRFAIFAGGTQTWDADSPISGTGTVRFTGGTHTINSVYNISDSTDVATAVTFNGSAPSVGPYLGISGNATFNTKDSLILSRLTMLSSTATFNTNDSVIVDRMVQSGGIMTGNSPIRVKTRYDWSGGYIYGSDSTVTFINSGIVNLTNNTRQVQKRTFINEGTLNWNAAHWDWDYGAIFINHQGALINITGDWYWNNFPNSGSDPMIYNYGTIHKSSGAGQSTINIPLYDSLATYEVASGTLAVQSNHTSKATNFNLSNGARYRIYGSTQYIDTSNTINGSGILDFNGGTAYVASRIPSVDSVTVSGGTVYFNQPDTLQFSVLSITSGGILNGSATVKINTRFAFNSGTLSGTDSTNTLIIGSNAVLNASGLNFFSKRTIDNYGTLNWTSSEWRVSNGAVFINRPGAIILTNSGSSYWHQTGSVPRVENYGTIRKSAGANTEWNVATNHYNGSRVEIKLNKLRFGGVNNATGAVIDIDSAATWQIDAANQTYDSSCTIQGKGMILGDAFGGTIRLRGIINVTGPTMTLYGSTYYFDGPNGHIIKLPKRIIIGHTFAATNVYFDRSDTAKLEEVWMQNGNFGGTSIILIQDTLKFTNSAIVGTDSSQQIIIAPTAAFLWLGTGSISKRTFNNYGTAIWTTPWGLDQNAVYNNMPGALTDWPLDGNTNWFTGTSNNFNNYGTLRKSGGTGISSFEYYVNNYGTIEAWSGTLFFGTSGTHAGGSFILSPGSTIDFAGGNHSFDASSNITGSGTVLISPTNFTMDGIYNIIGNTTIGGGTVNFDSTFSTSNRLTITGGTVNFRMPSGHLLNAGNRLNVSGGTANFITTDSLKVDTLLVNGTAGGNNPWFVRHYLQLTGTLSSNTPAQTLTLSPASVFDYNNGTLFRRVVNNYGTANWNNPVMFDAGAVYNNMPGATTTLATDVNSNWMFAAAKPYLNNYGLLRKSGGTGISSFEYQISNYGTLQVDSGLTILCYDSLVNFSTGIITGKGVLDVGTRFDNYGTIRPGASPGKLRFTGNINNKSTAAYDAEISGKNIGQFDELRASGAATLAGTVNVNLLNGFLPALGDTFKIMNYASKSGGFGAIQGLRTGGPYDFVPMYKDTALFLVTADSSNTPPVAVNDIVTASEDVPSTLSVLRNDTDTNGDALRIVEILSGFPYHGTVVNGSGDTTIVYTSASEYSGSDSLQYVVADGRGGLDTAAVKIAVNSVNDRPDAKDTTTTVTQYSVVRINVLATATDVENQTLSVSAVSRPKFGDAQIDGTSSSVVYIPNMFYTGVDSFKFYVSDGSLADSATMFVTVTSGDSFLVTWSKFDAGMENWSTVNDVSDSAYRSTGGNPGGYFTATDAVTGAWWYFNAPSKFLGDLSSVYDKTLRYDIKQSPAGTDNSQPDVILIGNGVQLNYDFPANPRTTFTSFGLVFNETAGWKKTSGSVPTQSELQNVLSNVTALRIRGEYASGTDSAGLDNVILEKAQNNNNPVVIMDTEEISEESNITSAVLDNDTDPENHVLHIASISQPRHGTATINSGNLTITYKPDSNFAGVDTVMYYAADNYGGQSFGYLQITVNNINDAPTISSAVRDTAYNEDFGKVYVARLLDIFGDVDNGLTFGGSTIASGATPYISNDSLYLLSVASFNGIATIELTANDGEYTIRDTFSVDITMQNDAPYVASAIRDTTLAEDFGRIFYVNLSDHFADIESDSLIYTIMTIATGVTAHIQHDSLYVMSVNDFHTATATLSITAGDGQYSVSDTFDVNVTPVNDPLVQTTALNNQTLIENFDKTVLGYLPNHFSDPDDATLSYTASVMSGNVVAYISGDTLYAESVAGFLGDAFLRITASDTQYTVADTLTVSVVPFNYTPTVVQPLRDTTWSEDIGKIFIAELNSHFTDVESSTLIYSGQVIAGSGTTTITNDSLYLQSAKDFYGNILVRITASDGALSVSDTLAVEITNVNDAPQIASHISDITKTVDFGKVYVEKGSNVFNDVDNDVLTMTATALQAGVNTEVSGDSLYIISIGGFMGSVGILVTAHDAEYSVTDTFYVTVNPENFPPTLVQNLRDTTFAEDFAKTRVYRLNSFFNDVDDINLSYSSQILSSGVSAIIAQDSLYLSGVADFNGIAVVRIQAQDSYGNSVADTINVIVTPVNDAPNRTHQITDMDLAQDFGKAYVDKLSAVFNDIDNGTLNYAVSTLNAGVNGLIQNDTLYLISTNGFTGASTLRITASDGEYTVADTLIVNVFSTNHSPVLAQMLRDTTLNEDFGRIRHSVLTQFFTDSDLDALTFTATAEAGVSTSIQNDTLYLTSTSQFSGTPKVIVSVSDGLVAISDTFTVTINSVNDAPSAFTLVTPVNNDLLTSLRPAFVWRKAIDQDGDVLSYSIEVSTNNTFASTVINTSTSDTSYAPASDLDSAQSYFWRITAHDGHGGNTVSNVQSFTVDAKRPTLSLWFNQGPILKSYIDLQVYSSEVLSGAVQAQVTMKNTANTVTDNRTVSLQRLGAGTLYTGKYQMNTEGSLTVAINAQDAAGNTRSVQRIYQVAAVSKSHTLALKSTSVLLSSNGRMKSSDGFILMGEDTEGELTEILVSTSVNIHGTIEISDALNLVIRLDKEMLAEASVQSQFDKRQIGIYRKTDMGYEYVGGQSDGYEVRAKIAHYGTYVALYRAGHVIVPDRLELAQNYPNPFNPSTTIEFGLTENGNVKIAVYNLLGQLVKTLVDEKREAGYHKIVWDGRNAAGQLSASGVYIYRLETKSGFVTRKMMLIK